MPHALIAISINEDVGLLSLIGQVNSRFYLGSATGAAVSNFKQSRLVQLYEAMNALTKQLDGVLNKINLTLLSVGGSTRLSSALWPEFLGHGVRKHLFQFP